MKITQAGEYALLALVYLAKQPEGNLVMIDDISKSERIPKGFLAKILQTLAKGGTIRSRQGARGGFALARPSREITILSVIETIEGKIAFQRCLEEDGCFRADSCTLCAVFGEAQNRMTEVFSKMTLYDLLLPKDVALGKVRNVSCAQDGAAIAGARPVTTLSLANTDIEKET
jgi:Rrf2 family protein